MAASTRQYLFTSESVTEGHPDKVADQISDGVLDAVLAQDPYGRVACETLVNTGLVVVSGEISTTASFDVQEIARRTIGMIGYVDADLGFSADSCAVLNAVDKQSADIAQGVDEAHERRTAGSGDEFDVAGAGDQGMMFGYASNEKLLISSQHAEGAETRIRDDLWEHVVVPVLPVELYDSDALRRAFLVNPTGRFVIGGPVGDCGLTGRKIIVDTYGGMARHGGGAFSGKDPSKVDRSAAYAARYVAKNVVAAGLADRAEVQVAYAIGVARPVSVMVETFGTEADGLSPERIETLVQEHFDLRPAAFREYLALHRPIYQPTAAYGHFGREGEDFTWERTDVAAALCDAAGLAEVMV